MAIFYSKDLKYHILKGVCSELSKVELNAPLLGPIALSLINDETITADIIEHLICSRHYAKCITGIILFNPCHRNPIVSIFIIISILQKRELEHREVE